MKRLDCTGLECPMPVIKAKQMLESSGKITLDVVVDNNIAVQNLQKLSRSLGMKSSVRNEENNFVVTMEKTGDIISTDDMVQDRQVILIKTAFLGYGNDELGATLMKGFIFSLTQVKPYPQKIMFLNSGVKLTSENEETVKSLKILEENGTNIISCGACLDFYNLKDDVKVGSIGNMYEIVDSLNKSTNKMVI